MSTREQVENGLALHRDGRLEAAEVVYREVLGGEPENADALHFLGLVFQQRGDLAEARRLIAQAISLDEPRPTFHYNLGGVLSALGDLSAAAAAYQRAIELNPDTAEAHFNLGTIRGRLRQYDEAIASFRRALALSPDYAEAHSGLGAALGGTGRNDEAAAACRAALAINPNLAEAHCGLGNALHALGNPAAAVAQHRKAVDASPKYATAHYNLGNGLRDLLDHAAAGKSYQRAFEINPDYQEAADNYLLNLIYDPSTTEADLFQAHRAWGKAAEHRLARPPDPVPAADETGRPLRVGYVSPDFRTHSCTYFVAPLFEAHDRSVVEIFAYANVARPDDMTDHLRTSVDHWRDISHLDDNQAAAAVRRDGIDILVDLAGHTRGNRLGVFARRPAPVQVAWLGYPATTGLSAIAYRVTDPVADPPGEADEYHTETLIRLPGGLHCYQPPDDPAQPKSAPHVRNGYVTFGSFNNLHKLSALCLDDWAEILRLVPDARLRLKGRLLDFSVTAAHVRNEFMARGIATERLILHGWIARDESPIALYNDVDIGLDPFPYNGTTTTFEALWMGVPVVTVRGNIHAARVGASILTHAGYPELIAESRADYVRRAVELAADGSRINHYRRELRDALLGSPLCDGARFSGELEQAFYNLWHLFCEKN